MEFSADVDLHKSVGAPNGMSFSFKSAYAKGEQKDGDPLTSVQPFSARVKLGFEDPSDAWGINTSLGYTAAKKANDAYYTNSGGERGERDVLSNSAAGLDIKSYYNINKGERGGRRERGVM